MKSYFRFLSRNKLYTLINVVGLVVSLMFIILLGDYTWRQFTIDSWHKHADQIVLIGSQDNFFMWPQAATDIKAMCPEVEQTCCVMSQSGKIKYGDRVVEDGDDKSTIMLADSTFFNFFDYELTQGNKRYALDKPDKCVITERLAKRLFGDKNPIGESVQITGERHVRIGHDDPYDSTLVYTVSAIAKDFDHTVLPNETQIIVSMQRYPQVMGYQLENYTAAYGPNGVSKVFFMLHPGTSLDSKKSVIADYLDKNYYGKWEATELTFTSLKDIMFAPQNSGAGMQKGDKSRLRILLAAVLAILFFAISNYINLTVANTGFRAKEMATRKLFGSSQKDISLKLIAESTLMVAVSFAIGLALAFALQDEAIDLFKGKIDLAGDISLGTVSVSIAFILLVGIISGIMPSWQISRFQPIDIVKGSFRYRSKMVLSKIFIILQNVVTVVMLTSALVIWLQLNHLIHAPLGYNTEHLFVIDAPDGKHQTVRNLLEKMPFVEKIGRFEKTSLATGSCSMQSVTRNDKLVTLYLLDLDKTAYDLYGFKKKKDYGQTSDGYYLTEEAMRQMEYTDTTTQTVWNKPIAGVLNDIHRINVLQGVEPFVIQFKDSFNYPSFLVKTNGDKQAKATFTAMLKEQGVPEADMEWSVQSLEESIAETFADQKNTLKIISLFTIVAIVISVMGFIGMSLFFIRQRQKEIGIRKIMGSTSHEVMALMLRTFCAPLLVSFVIAIPLSWYVMTDWLSNFSYRISLSPWIFAVTCAFALLVAVLSVSIQIIKAVRTNPVESIKTE
ncbi:ABC transporter permease [Xylanibacter ruminicola]|uniref:ABC transporter, permease protein n=2 Tax=Xylanibacter ruminicola TaxID=839 RepID=D5EUF3_XYLR2|nr:ABC transporter permease [Xylanibacter ruminicola]ADE82998.1 ABC transporter, permease protein [Xylanibacter ruminicola 23]GJG34398.1 ABC transporter permease [Xylanibacter ruminicola]SEH59778.1 putative ABC transport system permease protein [Xylanibacter ruminicola]